LSGNLICKMVGGLFVLYVVFRSGLILRLGFICVPWQLLWCSWVDISVFLLINIESFDSYRGVVYIMGGEVSCCLKIVGS
jgi:hypothetical protein